MRTELLPCPFCGKTKTLLIMSAQELEQEDDDEPEFWEHSDSWAVLCNARKPRGPGGCGASGGFFATVAQAVSAWNTRYIAGTDAKPASE